MSRRYLLATAAAAALLLPSLARADSTVAALTAASALAGPELFYCVQAAADHNCTATQLRTFIAAGVGTVTSVGLSLPGGVFTVSGSPVSGSGTLTATPAGTSGGVPYFSSATSMASSGLLTLNTPVLGGGAGGAPTSGTVSGNTTKFATVNATTFATGQCVQVDASSNLTTTGSACGAGGGGTPGGANTNVQFNNGGVFGGDAGFTYAGNGQVTLALGTITTNNKALNITGTWNAAGVTFDAPLLMNITNTASAAGSMIADLQVGGTTVFSLAPNIATFSTTAYYFGSGVPPLLVTGSARFDFLFGGSSAGGTTGQRNVSFGSGGITVSSGSTIGWASGLDTGAGPDTQLFRDAAANIIAQRSGAAAQTFRVYNIFNTSSDYERGVFDWTTTANTLTIGSQAAGTGSLRGVKIVGAGSLAVASSLVYNNGAANVFSVAVGALAQLYSSYTLAWGSGDSNSANDTGVGRNAAGIVEVDNGNLGTYRDLITRHHGGGGTAPTANTCAGFALGTGGGDFGGKITYTSATTCSVNFGTAFTNAPACTVTPGTAAASALVTTTTAVMSVTFGAAQTAFSYHCVGL